MHHRVVEVAENVCPVYDARRAYVLRVAKEVRDLRSPQPWALLPPIACV